MADFAGTVRHWMGQRGVSVRGLARAAHYDQGLLSKVLNGHRPYSPYPARKGQADGQPGTAAHVRLAAQEMRCAAMVGDLAGMADARCRAANAMNALGPSVPASGAYSVPQDSDPLYTATSLLLTGKYREAAEITRRVIESAYSPRSRAPGDQPTAYSRTLLILALAVAGLGEADEAAAAGAEALQAGPVVWPTMVLAGKLNDSLTRTSVGSAHADGFRARYADAAGRLALSAAGKQT